MKESGVGTQGRDKHRAGNKEAEVGGEGTDFSLNVNIALEIEKPLSQAKY